MLTSFLEWPYLCFSVISIYKLYTSSWFTQAQSLFMYFVASCVKHNWAGPCWTQVPPGPLHTWGLSSKNTKDAKYCTKDANSANSLAVTSFKAQYGTVKRLLLSGSLHGFLGSFLFEPHCSSHCPIRLLQRLLWYSLSQWNHDAPLCTLCVYYYQTQILLEGYYM